MRNGGKTLIKSPSGDWFYMNPQSPEKAPVPLSSDRLNKAPFESDCPPSLSYSPQIPFFFLEIIFQNKLLIASTFLNLVSLGTQFKILGTTSSSINRHSRWILELDQLNSDKDPIFVDKWGDLNPCMPQHHSYWDFHQQWTGIMKMEDEASFMSQNSLKINTWSVFMTRNVELADFGCWSLEDL